MTKKPAVKYLGISGPPSSALPKNATFRRTIREQSVVTAHIVNIVTLNPKVPASITNPSGVSCNVRLNKKQLFIFVRPMNLQFQCIR